MCWGGVGVGGGGGLGGVGGCGGCKLALWVECIQFE